MPSVDSSSAETESLEGESLEDLDTTTPYDDKNALLQHQQF